MSTQIQAVVKHFQKQVQCVGFSKALELGFKHALSTVDLYDFKLATPFSEDKLISLTGLLRVEASKTDTHVEVDFVFAGDYFDLEEEDTNAYNLEQALGENDLPASGEDMRPGDNENEFVYSIVVKY